MKKIKLLLNLFIILLLAVCVPYPAKNVRAEEKEAHFARLEAGQEFIVCIEWETVRPAVRFVSPSGGVYDTATETEDTRISVGDTMLYYYIMDAEAGNWRVIYDKYDDQDIYITLETTTAPFVVRDVSASNAGDTTVDVSFFVEYEVDRSINYKIYVSANEDSMGKELYHGFGRTNTTNTATVDLSTVGSYEDYKLYVYAWFRNDGVDIFDGAYSNSFSYQNPNQKEMTGAVRVEIYPNELMAKLCWEPERNKTYIVSLFEDGSPEPSLFDEVSGNEVGSFDFVYGVDAKKIELRIAEKYGRESYSVEKSFVCDLSGLPEVVFEDADATNRGYVQFHYKGFPKGKKVTVTANDVTKELTLSDQEEGNLEVALEADYNTVRLLYFQKDDVCVIYEKEIFYDNIPPRIYMLQDYTDVKTSESTLRLLGTVSGASRLTIGQEEVQIAPDGSFSHTVTLNSGRNVISVIAEDPAGNGAQYTVSATYTPGASSGPSNDDSGKENVNGGQDSGDEGKDSVLTSYLPLLITGVPCLVLVIVFAVLPKKKTRNGVVKTITIMTGYLGILGLGIAGFCFYQWKNLREQTMSMEFIDKAYASVDTAGELLRQEDAWMRGMMIGGAAAAVCAAAVLVIAVLRVVLKRKSGG